MKKTALLTLSLILIAIHPVWAQSDSTEMSVLGLPAVQITASSKEFSVIANQPVSSSLLTNYRISAENIAATTDLTARIPNLYMPEYGSKLTSPVYIRGIGSRINSPSVGLYVNDIPYFEKGMYKIDLDNVKLVEVLRGPQGTLYGRNTMGGVINLYTFTPFDRQGTNVRLLGGTFNDFSARLTHNAVIGKKLGLTLSAGYKHDGGDFKNITMDEYVGRLDDVNASLRLEYRLNDLWRIAYVGTFADSKQKGYPYAPIDPAMNQTTAIVYNQESGYDQLLTTHGLHIRRESEKTLFTSVTAFQWLKDEQYVDQDFTADSIYFATQGQKQVMLSQEFVLRSNKENARYQWLFGAFGFWQDVDSNIDVDVYKQKAAEYRLTDVRTLGGALFHQSRLNDLLIENLSLEAGLRLDAEKSAMDYDYAMVVNGNKKENPHLASDLDFIRLVPKVGLMYKYADNVWFASVTCGYKTGGFNTGFELDSDKSFEPENSINYEIGYRSQQFANLFNIDVSLFYIDWRNQQIYATNPSGRGSVLRNAGESHSTGLEASLNIMPLRHLSFDLEYGYTYAVFDKNVKSETEDYSGNFIPYVPRNTLSVVGLYHIYLNKFIDRISLMAQYSGIGQLYWDETNQSEQPFYGLLNAQVEFSIASKYKISLWGKNLCDANYNVFDFKIGASRFGQRGMPVTIGATINLSF